MKRRLSVFATMTALRRFRYPYACALVALAVFAASPARASTGFKSSGTLDSSNVGKTLYDGTVYVVPQNATISRSTPYTALYVADGATAVIYVPTGVTLTVKGGNASGTEGAGAGIRVPPTSTLVVTGGGTLNVTGGNAANGAKGGDWRKNGSWNGSADAGPRRQGQVHFLYSTHFSSGISSAVFRTAGTPSTTASPDAEAEYRLDVRGRQPAERPERLSFP